MPQLVPVIKAGAALVAKFATAKGALATIAKLGVLSLASKALAPKPNLPRVAFDKLVTFRGTVEPQRFVYGEDLVSGLVVYQNLSGPQNQSLHILLALSGHRLNDIRDVWFDGNVINDADINDNLTSPGTGNGEVTAGQFRGNLSLQSPTFIQRRLGDEGFADTILNGAIPGDWTANHLLTDIGALSLRLDLFAGQEEVFANGAPRNIRAVVRGFECYDPRLDDTNGGTGPHRLNDDTTWEWTQNPALVWAHFRMNEKFGYNEDSGLIDWPRVATAADRCDTTVTVPDGQGGSTTQPRYTLNGTFNASQSRDSVNTMIENAMQGWSVFSQGQWRLWAGGPQTATVTLDESNLGGKVTVQAARTHRERWNAVRGNFIEPGRNYQAVAYIEQRSSAFLTEDGGGTHRYKQIDFPLAHDEYECQRNALVELQRSRRMQVVIFEGNWSCLPIQPGRVVALSLGSLPDLSANFLCTEWKLRPGGGVTLTLVEWDDTDWDDPVLLDYTERSASGAITFNDFGVPAPTALAGTGDAAGHSLSWTPPTAGTFSTVQLWTSATNDRAVATLLAEVDSDSYNRGLTSSQTAYYWVRARDQFGRFSAWEPASSSAGVEVIGGPPSPPVPGKVWQENFDFGTREEMEAAGWVNRTGGGAVSFPNNGELGGRVFAADAYSWWAFPGLGVRGALPFDPDKLYRLTARWRTREQVDDNRFYFGVEGVDADGVLNNTTGADSFSSQHYVALSAFDADTVPIDEWQVTVGYFKGHAATGQSQRNNPLNPAALHEDTRGFNPLFIGSYLAGTNNFEVDFMRVEEIDEDESLLVSDPYFGTPALDVHWEDDDTATGGSPGVSSIVQSGSEQGTNILRLSPTVNAGGFARVVNKREFEISIGEPIRFATRVRYTGAGSITTAALGLLLRSSSSDQETYYEAVNLGPRLAREGVNNWFTVDETVEIPTFGTLGSNDRILARVYAWAGVNGSTAAVTEHNFVNAYRAPKVFQGLDGESGVVPAADPDTLDGKHSLSADGSWGDANVSTTTDYDDGSAAYEITASDRGDTIEYTDNTQDGDIEVDTNANEAKPANVVVTVVNETASRTLTITPLTGVTFRFRGGGASAAVDLDTEGQMAQLQRRGSTDEWWVWVS